MLLQAFGKTVAKLPVFPTIKNFGEGQCIIFLNGLFWSLFLLVANLGFW